MEGRRTLRYIMSVMKALRVIVFVLSVAFPTVMISCAGLAAKPTAQSEFDLGLSLFDRGKYEEAVKHFERATELQPDFGRAYLYIGRSYLNLSKWREAIPPLRAAFRLAPEESRKELEEIILDILLHEATKMDIDSRSEMQNLLREK